MPGLRRLPLQIKIAAVGVIVMLLMLVALATATTIIDDLTDSQKEEQLTVEVVRLLAELQSALVDMETGVRGYVIAERPEFLEPYQAGLDRYPEQLAQLAALMEGDTAQLARLDALRSSITTWRMEVLAPEILAVQQHETADALAAVRAGTGKAQMDQIRIQIADIASTKEHQAAVLARQVAEAAQRRWRMYAMAFGAMVSSLVVAYAVSRSVTRPLTELVAGAEQVANGQVGTEVTVHAEDEVGRLAAAFNKMSRALLAQQEEMMAQNHELMAQQEELTAQNEELHAQQEALAATSEQLAKDRDRLQRLNQFARSLGDTDLASLADRLLADLLTTAGAEVGALALLQREGSMRIQSERGLTSDAAQATRLAGFFAEAVNADGPIVLSYPHGGLLRPVYHTDLPVEHELYLPIRFGGETLAVAALGRIGPVPFARADTDWLGVMAAQAAATLSHALGYVTLQEAFSDLQDSAAHIEELNAQLEAERDRVRTQHDNLRAILASTSEGICLVTPAGLPLLVNDRFWALTGLSPDPTATLDEICDLLQPRLKAPACPFTQVLQDGAARTDLLELTGPPPRMLGRYATPVHAGGGGLLGHLFVLRDITRETEIDRMKTEFISTVSHELRTPLTAIRGYVELILDGDVGEVAGEQREFLELVAHNTVRLANLINDLLDVEKIEQGRISIRRERVPIGPLLQHVVDTFRVNAAEKGLACDLQVPKDLPDLIGDPDRLTQALANLVSNAVKYTKTGAIAIAATPVDAHSLRMTVTDTGIGIAPEHLPHLFTKFYRVDNQYTREVGGTGLGLAITKAIVERHGGTISVISESGRGTTFTITLPVHTT